MRICLSRDGALMNIILEMKSGPAPSRKLIIAEGRKSVIGRASSANFSFPDDKFLSTHHCILDAMREGCRVTDLGSSNGTFLNGARVKEALLKEGDELAVGRLKFLVHLSEELEAAAAHIQQKTTAMPARPPAAEASSSPLRIGNWSFRSIPPGWELVEGHGIRDASKGAFPSSVIVGKDVLQPDMTLAQYIQVQLVIIRAHIPEARSKEIKTATFPPAQEASLLEIELATPDGRQGIQRQLYARFGSSVGVVTLTALASDLPRLEPLFESIRAGLTFRPE